MTRLRDVVRRPATLCAIVCLFLAASSASAQNRAHWMREAKWGVMTHYLADWRARTDNLTMNVETWNQLVDNFDVEGLADQLKAVGAGYQILTIGQNSGYFAAPNPTYDRITGIQPSKCSRRDLISDMATALSKRGIKLIVYLPAGAPAGDRAAREALQWQEGAYRNVEFQLKWEQVIRDWSVRFGTKVVGWWYDGCFWPNTMYRTPDAPNFSTFAAAARAGNPESALAFNMGSIPRVISSSPFDDYTGGEETNPARMEIRRASGGMLDGVQLHVLSYLGKAWGTGDPRFSNEDAINYSMEVRKLDGAITWDVPVQKNGLIPKPIMDQLAVINKAVREQPAAAPAPAPKPRAAWMQGARWGVMSHFLADWVTRTNKITLNVENWNKLVDGFDVEGVAKQLESVGAGYYLICHRPELGVLSVSECDAGPLCGNPAQPVFTPRPGGGSLPGAEQARHQADGVPGPRTWQPGRRDENGAEAGWRPQCGVPAQSREGHSRMVRALGDKCRGVVVRRLLPTERHLPELRTTEFRQPGGGGAGREPGQRGRLQSRCDPAPAFSDAG